MEKDTLFVFRIPRRTSIEWQRTSESNDAGSIETTMTFQRDESHIFDLNARWLALEKLRESSEGRIPVALGAYRGDYRGSVIVWTYSGKAPSHYFYEHLLDAYLDPEVEPGAYLFPPYYSFLPESFMMVEVKKNNSIET